MQRLLEQIINYPETLVLLIAAAFFGIGAFLLAEEERKARRKERGYPDKRRATNTRWRRFLFRQAGKLPCRLIDINGQPYLERYHVGTLFGCRIYLHRFVRRDAERHVHNHPWRWALSLVLAGLYIEELATHDDPACGYQVKHRRVAWWNWISPTTRHRIFDVEPETWTLFITGPRFKGWGFYEVEEVIGTHGQLSAVIFLPYGNTNHDWHQSALTGDQIGREPIREAA